MVGAIVGILVGEGDMAPVGLLDLVGATVPHHDGGTADRAQTCDFIQSNFQIK